MDDVRKALEIFDRSGKGVISFKDFQEITGNLYDPFNNDDALAGIFNRFDTKRDGYLYAENVLSAAQDLKMPVTADEAGKIIEAMDFDQDGAVDLKEFKSVVKV